MTDYPRDDYEEESCESCPVCECCLDEDGDCKNPSCSQYGLPYSRMTDDGMSDLDAAYHEDDEEYEDGDDE